MPEGADRIVFWLAPAIKAIPALLVVAVIPLGPSLLIPWFDGLWYRVPLGLTDANVGVLYILAFMSLGTYGIALAGWSSNNKYAMLGSLRATAQMVSYELSMGLTMAVPILITGSMSLGHDHRRAKLAANSGLVHFPKPAVGSHFVDRPVRGNESLRHSTCPKPIPN